MRLLRFDKTLKFVFALLCAVGFSTAFAANDANIEGCGRNDEAHCSGPKYRCLKYFGHSKSTKLNTNPAGNQTGVKLGKYCLPRVATWCDKYYDTKTKKEIACNKDDRDDQTNPKCNMKEWDWDEDSKVDTVTETETSKKYCNLTSCEFDGKQRFWYGAYSSAYHPFYQPDTSDPGYDEPIDVYFYCALEGEDFNGGAIASDGRGIAKCVDRASGEITYNSQCDADPNGIHRYYKPNCTKNTNSPSDCSYLVPDPRNPNRMIDEGRMAKWNAAEKIKMCYKPWNQNQASNIYGKNFYDPNAGGQSVSFSKYHLTNQQGVNGPCKHTPYYITLYPGIYDNTKGEMGALIITDRDDKDRAESLVHTKVSGESYYFKIKETGGEEDENGDSAVKKVECKITNAKDDNELFYKGFAEQNSGIKARILALFSGNKSDFIFPTKSAPFKPLKSGDYKITCTPYDKNDTAGKEASVDFFVAPYRYVFGDISAVFKNTTASFSGVVRDTSSGEVRANLISKEIELEHTNSATAAKTENVNLSWDRKPVVKIGDDFTIRMLKAQAQTKDRSIDTGVDWATNKIGRIIAESAVDTLAITNGDNPQNASATTNTKCLAGKAKDDFNPIMNTQSLSMVQGIADGSDPIATISTLEAQVARATLNIYDVELYERIKDEKAKDKCGADGFDCPFPQVLRLTNVDYEIAPQDFQVELVDKNDNPIKVLYFGQGTSPKVEAGSKVKVTALKISGTDASQKMQVNGKLDDADIAKTFTFGCAAQNMQFAAEGGGTGTGTGGSQTGQGNGYYFEIIGRDGSGFTVQAKDFSEGVAGSDDAIIKVLKDKDTPFTPAMKSEPVIVDSNNAIIPTQMQYEKFPPESSYYPKYSPNITQSGSLVILRGRINAIDTDNGSGTGAGGSIDPTKVWYEFQCEYCNLDEISKITGYTYTAADRSPTQQGWWIDRTFGEHNGNYITQNKIEIENGGLNIGSVSPNNGVDTAKNRGMQTISYGGSKQGTYKLNIRHGNESTDGTFKGATTMPYFLLYNVYWTGYADVQRDNNGNEIKDANGKTIPTSTLISPTKWNTSSFIYVKGKAPDDPRDYGVDTGGAKNTRSGGRTGKF